MASPFTIFRKHQKILIAALGLMAMIAFVFLSNIEMMIDSGMDPGASVVVSTEKFGNLTQRQVQLLLYQRQIVIRFVQAAVSQSLEAPIPFGQIEQLFGPVSEKSVVDSWLLNQYAREMGMRVSDSIINRFIQTITQDQLSAEQLGAIVKEMEVPEHRLFDAIREELTALYFARLYFATPDSVQVDLMASTPVQRWEYFGRLHQRATTQLIPVPVEKFVSEIEDPGDKTLKEFFEQYKTDYADPASPEPGFHQPRRVKLEYVVAERDAFVNPDAVTDEEILAYYEENKDRLYVRLSLPGIFEEDAPSKTPGPEPPMDAPESTEPPTDEKPTEDAPTPEEPAEEKPSEEAPEAEEGSEEAPPQTPPPSAPPEGEVETPESPAEGTSSDPRPENAGGEAPNEPTETPSEVAPREGESPEAKPEEATEPEEEATVRRGVFQLVSETKAEELPAEDVAGAEGNAPTAEDSAEEDSGDADEYIPLAEVKEEIREILARERAGERMQAALAPISEKMAEFRDKWVVADAMRAEGDEKVEEVPRPDVAAMAKEAGLEFEETPMVDFNAAAKLPIGLATVNAMQPLLRLIFGENYPRFRHGIAEDLEGNQYLFWIVGEEEERIPEFTDEGVRERVLDTWRMIQARKPAREEAARLTEQAEKAGKSLKDEFGGKPGYEVLEPQPFSWLTRGPIPSMTSQQPPRISRVEGVEIPGRDFMKAVFALNPGEFGVAMNNPETVVYAVEMVELQPSARALWELFRLDDFGKYADAALGDQRERISAWRTSLEQEAGLKWERKPHPYRPSR